MLRENIKEILESFAQEVDKTMHKLGVDIESNENTYGIRCNKIMGATVFIFGNYNDDFRIYSINEYNMDEIIDFFEEYLEWYNEKLENCKFIFTKVV